MNRREAPNPIGPEIQRGPTIHELGGLSPQHWKKVIDKIDSVGRRYSFEVNEDVRRHVLLYANHVIDGELPAGGFDASNYLGRRHWVAIASYFPIDDNNLLGRVDVKKEGILGFKKKRSFVL